MQMHDVRQRRKSVIEPQQVKLFLAAIGASNDLFEIRVIETWSDGATKRSRPVRRYWLRPQGIVDRLPELGRLNETANIFVGVNPRISARGTKDSVAFCRCVWADIDNISQEEAFERWRAIRMPPTVVVNSGHGIHMYWQLAMPFSVRDARRRRWFESLVRNFSEALGGDHTQDVSRVLRLPGTVNRRNHRNGQPATSCTLTAVDAGRVYPLVAFKRWAQAPDSRHTQAAESDRGLFTPLASASLGRTRDHRRIEGLLRHLCQDVPDRSRRDFGVVLGLLELGLTKAEIRTLVADQSKFADAGDSYFDRTVENALRKLRQ
jgi:hypothetical protein